MLNHKIPVTVAKAQRTLASEVEATRATCPRLRVIVEGPPPTISVSSALEVYNLMRFLEIADREQFFGLHLNSKNKFLGMELISMGTLTNSLIHPREVFKAAIINNSARIILCHNHPSGDPRPSQEDKMITERIMNVGEIVGIEVRDHVVIGTKGRYCSMKDKAFMNVSSSSNVPASSIAADKNTNPDRAQNEDIEEIIHLIKTHPETKEPIFKILKARKQIRDALETLAADGYGDLAKAVIK